MSKLTDLQTEHRLLWDWVDHHKSDILNFGVWAGRYAERAKKAEAANKRLRATVKKLRAELRAAK